MFKNAIVYRLPEGWEPPPLAALEEALAAARFVPCGATERESAGWVEPRGQAHAPLVEVVGGEWILRLAVESRLLPASVLKDRVAEKVEAFKQERGLERVGKAVRREFQEEAERELLPRAFTKRSSTVLWLSPEGGLAVVGAGSVKKADRVTTALVEALLRAGWPLDGLGANGEGPSPPAPAPRAEGLQLLQTATAPATAMAHWLASREAPRAFTVDRDCELKGADEDRATVRYARHALDTDEVVDHIARQGKRPTRLAMTHEGRVSFVLAEDMGLKRLELLDVVLDAAGEGTREDGGFEADVALMTGELRRLLPDLVEALGGPAEAAGADPAAPAAPAVPAANDPGVRAA